MKKLPRRKPRTRWFLLNLPLNQMFRELTQTLLKFFRKKRGYIFSFYNAIITFIPKPGKNITGKLDKYPYEYSQKSHCVCMCVFLKTYHLDPSVLSQSEQILQTCLDHHLPWMSLHHHRRYSLHFSPVLVPAP